MSRELKVYNEHGELILHVEHTPLDSRFLVVDGTREMSQAIRALQGQYFERAAMIDGQLCEFRASWDDTDFLDSVAAYWTANFGWRTRLVHKTQKCARVAGNFTSGEVMLRNVMVPTLPVETSSPWFFYDAFACPKEVFVLGTFQFETIVTNEAFSADNQCVMASVVENHQARKPKLIVLKTAA